MLLKLFPLIGSAALLYLVLQKQTFVFQKYTVYTYSVAIDTNIYKETSRLEWNSLEKKSHKAFPSGPPRARTAGLCAINSSGLLQNTIEEYHTLGAEKSPHAAEVWSCCCLFLSPPFVPTICLGICIPHPNPPQPPVHCPRADPCCGQSSALLQRGKCGSRAFGFCL